MVEVVQNERFIQALLGQPVDRTPLWMMRQAGRYLPEYRELRAKVPDFMTFCKNPDLACEVTLQPLERFDLDAAIIFSDILTVPEAMGMQLEFISGQGPVIHNPIRTQADLKQLRQPDVADELGYVMQAIKQTRAALAGRVPLIGFAGSPWTVATYMVEGAGSKLFQTIRRMQYQAPEMLHDLLTQITQVTIDYLSAQIEAGAQAIMVFDTWGGILPYQGYLDFSLNYMRKIAVALNRERDGWRIPLIFFTKQADPWLEEIAASGCDAMGLDWTIDVARARERVGAEITLQGNLDPMVLFSDVKTIEHEVQRILFSVNPTQGFVFNLGHGIDKETPIENVHAMIQAVRQYGVQHD